MKTFISTMACASVVALGMAITTPVQAADFSGKIIQLIVPFKESGGATRYARLWQIYMQKYLPGKPRVLVVNKPGGSGIKGANWFQKNATNDGLTLIAGSTSMYTSYLFGGKKVKYKLLTWKPIILSPLGTQFYALTSTGVKGKNVGDDIRALQKAKGLITGAKNPTSSELRGAIAYDLLGLKDLRFVFGLNSGGRRKAVMRGELQLSYDSAGSFMKKTMKYVMKGKVAHYMNLGYFKPDGTLGRDPAFPDTPTFIEAYKAVHGKAPSGTGWEALKHLIYIGVMSSKALILPAGVSDDIRNTYISTIKTIWKDKKFRKLAKKELGNYPQSFGDDAAKVLKNAVDVKPKTRKWIGKFLKRKFDFNMPGA